MSFLQPVGERLWIADGPEVSFYGFPTPTRMAVARLPDGQLWIWSPIALDEQQREELETLGELRHVDELVHLDRGIHPERAPFA